MAAIPVIDEDNVQREDGQARQILDQEKVEEEENKQILSKRKLKKLVKRQKYLEARPAKRKLEKERKKARKKAAAEERERLGIELPEVKKITTKMSESTNNFRVVIDMDFEDYMTEYETAKAIKQLGRIYSLNRHTENPCQLYFTSIKGKILDKINSSHIGYQKWDVNISDLSFIDLFSKNDNDSGKCVKQNLIYLSGDSEEVLPEVEQLLKDESQIFVIGGIVDHNRHKNLCQDKASKLNIRTAKLPIKENIKLCQRHILSTVTVFEILLNVFSSKRQWTDALRMSIPKRKIAEQHQDNDELE